MNDCYIDHTLGFWFDVVLYPNGMCKTGQRVILSEAYLLEGAQVLQVIHSFLAQLLVKRG